MFVRYDIMTVVHLLLLFINIIMSKKHNYSKIFAYVFRCTLQSYENFNLRL